MDRIGVCVCCYYWKLRGQELRLSTNRRINVIHIDIDTHIEIVAMDKRGLSYVVNTTE